MKTFPIQLGTFLTAFFFAQSNVVASSVPNNNLVCIEGDAQCTFVLLSGVLNKELGEPSHKLLTINQTRANNALSPFSTFKITNSVIALEKEIIKDTKQVLSYDKEKYPTQVWWPPVWKLPSYNLSSAFKYSVVPVFRQMAKNIGQKHMNTYLERFDYGNQDASSGIDNFWLNGSLKISAVEQVTFLQKLFQNQFKLSSSTLAAIKEVMLVETTENYKLYGKTGAGKVTDKSMLGWYVGFVENKEGVHYFAFNFNRNTYGEMKAERIKTAMNHLKLAGVID